MKQSSAVASAGAMAMPGAAARSTPPAPDTAPQKSAPPAADAPRRPAGMPEPPVTGVGAWIVAWGEFALLGYLALIGAFFASADASPGDYACGVTLALAAIALAFLRLKARFDGAGDWASFLLVDDWPNLAAVIVAFVILGLAGLFIAAAVEYGALHNAGIALFLASGAAVFLHMKHVFDNLDRQA